MKPLQRTMVDAELGPVRWCSTCDEWWPDDEEFWRVVPAGSIANNHVRGRPYTYVRRTDVFRCRAHSEVRRTRVARRNRYRIPNAHRCRSNSCIVIVPPGRDLCYGCRGLTAGPLTSDRLAQMLWST